jgi:putative ABC transport system ATP-binding protein
MTDQPATSAFISVANLCRAYGQRTAQGGAVQTVLSGVTFTLRRGETVALLGRSGSGKSTLLNLISGIDLADAGQVVVDGCELGALSEQQRTLFRRRHIGFIYQFFNLVPSLTAAENLALVLELNGMAPAQALQRAAAALAEVGLPDKLHSYPAQLSGGEQQRVAIARAAIHRPALILADEPTGNLDAVTGRQMLQLLRAQVRTVQSSMLLVTHSLAVAQTADRILTLEQGSIEERNGDFAW